jgi:hypothetical protein
LQKKLIELNIDFIWVCNNPNKIDRIIYNKQLKSIEHLDELDNYQSIITVANKESQSLIKIFFDSKGYKIMRDYYFFC